MTTTAHRIIARTATGATVTDSHWFATFERDPSGSGVRLLRHWRDELPAGVTIADMRKLPAFRIIEADGAGRIAVALQLGTAEAGRFTATETQPILNARNVFEYRGEK
jgi:hypothetical protein